MNDQNHVSLSGFNRWSMKLLAPAAILLSGLAWYLSFGLLGDYGWLIWVAPIPVLWICFQVSWKNAFMIAFTAYLIGRLSWLPYLLTVLPLVPALLFTLSMPLVFALLVVQTRKVVLVRPHWLAAFAFPVLLTAFEYLVFVFSPDGTAGSIAYSISGFLPVIQIASVTGIAGITFLILLIPSAIAVGWHYRHHRETVIRTIVIVSLTTLAVFLFGIIRIVSSTNQGEVKTGLIVMEEALHEETDDPDTQKELHLASLYAEEISRMGNQGVKIVVLPEKALTIKGNQDSLIMNLLVSSATKNKVAIVAGITRISDQHKENKAWAISSEGKILADYQKVNLFEGEIINGFSRGTTPAIFLVDQIPAGVAICKDLDFEQYIRKYNQQEVSVLFVPAWDFVKDDWLHSRMAILRGVENGYSMVRVARQGRLTISDHLGKVLYEASSAQGNAVTLSGMVPLKNNATIYGKTGDWFAMLTLLAAMYYLFVYSRIKKALPFLPTSKTQSLKSGKFG